MLVWTNRLSCENVERTVNNDLASCVGLRERVLQQEGETDVRENGEMPTVHSVGLSQTPRKRR